MVDPPGGCGKPPSPADHLIARGTLEKRRDQPGRLQPWLGIIISATSVSSVKSLLTNTDMALNLCLAIVPEIDPHRTVPTGLPGLSVVMPSQRRVLSMEKPRRWPAHRIQPVLRRVPGYPPWD